MRGSNAAILVFAVTPLLVGQTTAGSRRYEKLIFGSPSASLPDFEQFAKRAKQSGATHISITAEDLPWARWQYDTPGDPYPAWVNTNTGLLKVAPPPELEKHIPAEYTQTVLGILKERCAVLRKLGLKAAFSTFEPQMLPEKVFEEHPLWRGARVDHPMRSRVARFAPSIDNPEVRALYRTSIAKLVRACPEIEVLTARTNDSGTGLDWSGGLYSGRFGNTLYRNRTMDERLRDFFAALQAGAKDSGGSLEIDLYWTREAEPERIAAHFGRGTAIEHLEGPDGRRFIATAGWLLDYENPFYPVIGIPRAFPFLDSLAEAAASNTPRLEVKFGDSANRDLYFRIFDRFRKLTSSAPFNSEEDRLVFLRGVAQEEAGEKNAPALLRMWKHLEDAERDAELLNSGGFIFYLGGVQQRWLTRPFVPFPERLTQEEKSHFRRFQFQARAEDRADDLMETQGNRSFAGEGRYPLSGRILDRIIASIEAAHGEAKTLTALPTSSEGRYQALVPRLSAFLAVSRNALNAVRYQAMADRVRLLGLKPETQPPVGSQSGWDRQFMLETARAEIDNTAVLLELLEKSRYPLLFLAPSNEEEDIRLLGPAIREQLRKKLGIMNSHWEDYKLIFTSPNL